MDFERPKKTFRSSTIESGNLESDLSYLGQVGWQAVFGRRDEIASPDHSFGSCRHWSCDLFMCCHCEHQCLINTFDLNNYILVSRGDGKAFWPHSHSTGDDMIETKRKGFSLVTQIPIADTASTSDHPRGSLACFPRFGASGRGGGPHI